ncbi:MAG: DinB family protein [Bacteroidetes bacterium]|nr:DinB family protein [Bacteroidota bacterium]
MKVNLDQYRDAPHDAETLAARREALIDQLGWLSDEAKALGPMLAELPAWALNQAPLPDDRTAKETLAHLTSLDREVYAMWIEQLVADEHPTLAEEKIETDSEANAHDIGDLLGDVREARKSLIGIVEAVPESEWTRKATLADEEVDLFDLALLIVRHDADCLRNLAYRLHEANLTDRP